MRYLSLHYLLVVLSLSLLTGCGKHLSGVYEGTMTPPAATSSNPKLREDLDQMLKKQNETIGMFLKFDGSEVEFGTKAGSKMGRYEIVGDKLEIQFDDGKTKVPMTLNTNGSITYMSFVFRKK